MKKRLKNAQAAVMLQQLAPFLVRRDQIGYAAARNYRRLADSLTEYEEFRHDLIEKYGEQTTDDTGLPIFQIKIDSPEFKCFSRELAPLNEVEHAIELMTVKYENVVDILSGEEILAIDWMLED